MTGLPMTCQMSSLSVVYGHLNLPSPTEGIFYADLSPSNSYHFHF